jgi:2Fe-2S ferredoxin
MPKVTFIEKSGATRVVDAALGKSLMEAARHNDVRGIAADCGGCCICGTCHVYIEPDWQAAVGPRTDIEIATMEFSESVESNSRLACQVKVTDELDGLVVRVVEE